MNSLQIGNNNQPAFGGKLMIKNMEKVAKYYGPEIKNVILNNNSLNEAAKNKDVLVNISRRFGFSLDAYERYPFMEPLIFKPKLTISFIKENAGFLQKLFGAKNIRVNLNKNGRPLFSEANVIYKLNITLNNLSDKIKKLS